MSKSVLSLRVSTEVKWLSQEALSHRQSENPNGHVQSKCITQACFCFEEWAVLPLPLVTVVPGFLYTGFFL